jgi:hypothetical protein
VKPECNFRLSQTSDKEEEEQKDDEEEDDDGNKESNVGQDEDEDEDKGEDNNEDEDNDEDKDEDNNEDKEGENNNDEDKLSSESDMSPLKLKPTKCRRLDSDIPATDREVTEQCPSAHQSLLDISGMQGEETTEANPSVDSNIAIGSYLVPGTMALQAVDNDGANPDSLQWILNTSGPFTSNLMIVMVRWTSYWNKSFRVQRPWKSVRLT